jgi:hypothetical protein
VLAFNCYDSLQVDGQDPTTTVIVHLFEPSVQVRELSCSSSFMEVEKKNVIWLFVVQECVVLNRILEQICVTHPHILFLRMPVSVKLTNLCSRLCDAENFMVG